MRAAVRPGTVNAEDRTVELVWSTGSRVRRGGFLSRPYLEELSLDPAHVRMDRLQSGAPLLDSHNSFELGGVIGVVQSARIEGGQAVASVRFAKAEDDPRAEAIFRKVQDGIIRNVSVGYVVHRLEKTEGGEGQIPVYRATDWEPYEISMVPMGADAGAGVRSQSVEFNVCHVVEGDDEHKERAMSVEDKTGAAAAAENEQKLRREAAVAERGRITEIRRIGGTLELAPEFVERAIEAGDDVEAFRAAAIDEHAKARKVLPEPGKRIEAVDGGDARDKWVRGVSDWMIERSGLAEMVGDAAKKRGGASKIDPGEFRGMSTVELARQALERAGVRTAGLSRVDLIGRALTLRAGGYMATGDFSTALENTMNKVLLAAYAVTPDTWTRFCAVGSVSDFRAHKRYRMGSFGSLATVAEGGEYHNMVIADASKETITADTKGALVGITRQALINDDMGAFSRMAVMVGRSAALTVEKAVYDLLAENAGLGPAMTDTDTLFHANHDNIPTGAALSAAAIDADRVAMGSQMDPSGNEYLDLRPAVLLVPLSLGSTARTINDAQYDPDTANKLQKPNAVRGLFRDIVDTARLTGTRRYLFADPSIAPTIEVAFLDGQRDPYLETENGWRVDGVEWKVRLDFACGAVDWRGAITNAGA
jgi:hypothetical protein